MTVNPYLSVVVSFVAQLRDAGVEHVCISPGSRSTPLAAACAREPDLRTWILLDERSAGFFAVGLARMTKRPVALVCTSGTAAANYLPAVMEARQSRVPLLIVTADRPPELRGVGSNQTVDQVKLYGSFVKWQADMPTPDGAANLDEQARTAVFRAVAAAVAEPAGPVHMNWPFREPLLPPLAIRAFPSAAVSQPSSPPGRQSPPQHQQSQPRQPSPPVGRQPFVRVRRGVRRFADGDLEALARDLTGAARGLIVCGPQDDQRLARSLRLLAEALQYPLLADPLSQARAADGRASMVVDSYDVMLRNRQRMGANLREALRPEVILRFGQTPTSKVLGSYLADHRGARQIVVDDTENWQDPFFCATDVLICDAVDLVVRLAAAVEQRPGSAFARDWLEADASVAAARSGQVMAVPKEFASSASAARTDGAADTAAVGSPFAIDGSQSRPESADPSASSWLSTASPSSTPSAPPHLPEEPLFEGRLFVELAHLLPEGSVLFAGNSMPVRDLDSFFPKGGRPLQIMANRGASGIDGVVSTALGVAAGAAESGRKVVLVIGDVSFQHDAGGLLAARQYALDLTVILVHNDGGGIFSFLPQSTPEDVFPYFSTPHGLDFEPLVRMYGGTHARIAHWSDFRESVAQSLRLPGLHVLEVRTDRETNAAWHQLIFDACSGVLPV
ncbi:MAG: 2-succinyl-5-enolpyruvyl-6-hydroxy-3-cyclohexene-1-carboxylic-acid synthase [Bacilli bacterium]